MNPPLLGIPPVWAGVEIHLIHLTVRQPVHVQLPVQDLHAQDLRAQDLHQVLVAHQEELPIIPGKANNNQLKLNTAQKLINSTIPVLILYSYCCFNLLYIYIYYNIYNYILYTCTYITVDYRILLPYNNNCITLDIKNMIICSQYLLYTWKKFDSSFLNFSHLFLIESFQFGRICNL